jgi:hypothetical protein
VSRLGTDFKSVPIAYRSPELLGTDLKSVPKSQKIALAFFFSFSYIRKAESERLF